MKIFLLIVLNLTISVVIPAQNGLEILTSDDVLLMKKSNLSKELIIRKVKGSKNTFDISVQSIVSLKNAGIDDEIIEAMMDGNSQISKKEPLSLNIQRNLNQISVSEKSSVRTIVNPADALRTAKTIAIIKTSLNPSKQALEKELFKRPDWQSLNLNVVRYKESADLYVEISYVHFSWITRRYVFHVYDNRSGTVIVAGEATSWGSLPAHLAREISKKLKDVFVNGK